jgi:hypothetical protein
MAVPPRVITDRQDFVQLLNAVQCSLAASWIDNNGMGPPAEADLRTIFGPSSGHSLPPFFTCCPCSGDTMNTASRMESTCKPGCIHVSDAFAKLLPSESWQSMGGVQVKGEEGSLWILGLGGGWMLHHRAATLAACMWVGTWTTP